MKLIIAEKPSVAQTIAAALGVKEKPRAVSTEQRERARQMMIAKNKAKGD